MAPCTFVARCQLLLQLRLNDDVHVQLTMCTATVSHQCEESSTCAVTSNQKKPHVQNSQFSSGTARDLCTTLRFKINAGPSPRSLLAAYAGWACMAFQPSNCCLTALLLQAAHDCKTAVCVPTYSATTQRAKLHKGPCPSWLASLGVI